MEGEKEEGRGYQYGFLGLQVTLEEVEHYECERLFRHTPIENCVSECSCGLGNLSFGISPQQNCVLPHPAPCLLFCLPLFTSGVVVVVCCCCVG